MKRDLRFHELQKVHSTTDLIGRMLGRCRVVDQTAAGGASVVLRAGDERLPTPK
jgi:hypothetical protein